jgi:hypothetical protein
MNQIWKYSLDPDEKSIGKENPYNARAVTVLRMPVSSRILSAQKQGDTPVLWVLVNPEAARENRIFYLFETGADLDVAGLHFVATIQLESDELVVHVFEDTKGR